MTIFEISRIGPYVRGQNTLIFYKYTLVFLKFDESLRRMRVQNTYFSYFSLVFSKMDLKIDIFDFLQMIYFWNPEIKSKRPLSKFFLSEVI
jgi:hypothetical protein